MGRQYPFYRCEHADAQSGAECCACDKRAVKSVRIAYSYMRGEDEFEPVCKRHFKMVENEEGRFFAHMATKERFLKGATND